MATTDRAVSIHPYFQAHEGRVEDVKALCQRFVEKTQEEEGCLYYAFSWDGDELHCREAYRDAAALLHHLESVGPLLEEIFQVADLTRVELHGPESELAELREPLADLKPRWFALECGFRA